MRSVDPDDFRTAVDEGVAALQKAGADVVLMNLQYSPRMETMMKGEKLPFDGKRMIFGGFEVLVEA